MNTRLLACSGLVAIAIWTSGCATDAAVPPKAQGKLAADSADQAILGMQSVLTEGGLKRADILSDTAYFYGENTRMNMQVVHAVFFTSTGLQNGVMTSDRATYNTNTGMMEAFGHVVVVSTDGRRLTTSQLKYDKFADKVTGDSLFKFVDPDKTTDGIGFDSDPGMNNLHVHIFLKGTAGAHPIPK